MGKWSQREYDDVLVRKVVNLFEGSIKRLDKRTRDTRTIPDKRFRTFVQQLDPKDIVTQRAFDSIVGNHFYSRRSDIPVRTSNRLSSATTSMGPTGLPIPADRRLPIRTEPSLRRSTTSLSNLRRDFIDDEFPNGINFSLDQFSGISPPPISLSRARNPRPIPVPMTRSVNANNTNHNIGEPASPPNEASRHWLEEYTQYTNPQPRLGSPSRNTRYPRTVIRSPIPQPEFDSDATSVPDEFDTLLDRPQSPEMVNMNRIIGRRRRRIEIDGTDSESEAFDLARNRNRSRRRLENVASAALREIEEARTGDAQSQPRTESERRLRTASPLPFSIDYVSPPPISYSPTLGNNDVDDLRGRDRENRRNGVVFDEVAMRTLFGETPAPTIEHIDVLPTSAGNMGAERNQTAREGDDDEERIRRELEDDLVQAHYRTELFGDIDRPLPAFDPFHDS
ncbi:hypothetical protein I204_07947 [Kwoniella mangroviensis CBS 8886]|uniref:uncharacterized protein n=1 Tax=Kwoniella mangroviensis CBS 8507 TaxID=1296122 RepID=UPI00080CF99F|nr:uncharacterized protein I203_01692 [Kwoniella mangroviensis CBS 8507]OCF69828.1 hypothetical protein I203_01692 [Kwoniella mangroviensis CBS 8507]OCF71320.1 hypothetical protein I204_07947 [Kwoniella mangroviensis CBS 8886]